MKVLLQNCQWLGLLQDEALRLAVERSGERNWKVDGILSALDVE